MLDKSRFRFCILSIILKAAPKRVVVNFQLVKLRHAVRMQLQT